MADRKVVTARGLNLLVSGLLAGTFATGFAVEYLAITPLSEPLWIQTHRILNVGYGKCMPALMILTVLSALAPFVIEKDIRGRASLLTGIGGALVLSGACD